MATNTTNYGFKKPDESDFYDVADQNKNWDLADEALKNLDTPTFEDYTGSTAVPSATDAIDQIKSKGKLGTLLSNIKAAFKGACLIGHIVNNCVTDNAGLPLSAAQGKVLKDLYTQLYSDLGAGCFKAFTFSDYSRDEDIKSVAQKMFTKLETGTCYRVKMTPLAGGTTSDAYVYCASSLFGVIHLQNHEGANYYGRLYNSTWTWDSYALKSDLTGLDAALSIREENGGVIVSFSSKDSKYGIYIGVGPNGVNANYKINGEWKKAIIIATKS